MHGHEYMFRVHQIHMRKEEEENEKKNRAKYGGGRAFWVEQKKIDVLLFEHEMFKWKEEIAKSAFIWCFASGILSFSTNYLWSRWLFTKKKKCEDEKQIQRSYTAFFIS